MDTDRKTALIIAGGVLAAFATIAVLTRSDAPPDPTPAVVPATVSKPASQPPAPSVKPVAVPAAEIAEPSAGTPEEAEAFQVEPGANYLARGIEAYQQRNFEHAVAYLQAETLERPDRPYAHYLLGLSLWKAGRMDEAAEAMHRATQMDGATVKGFINLSRIENDRGLFDEALEAALGGLALEPDNAEALFLQGRSLRNLEDRDAAAAALQRSVGLEPGNGFAWNLLGLVQLERQQDTQALEALQRAAELEPDVAYIHNNLGMALERTGDRAAAVAAYRRAVELEPTHDSAARNLARLEPQAPAVPEETDAIALGEGASDGDDIR